VTPEDRNLIRGKYNQFLPAPNATMIIALVDENEAMEREVARWRRWGGKIREILEGINE
jgi:hypothetical protein